MKRVLVPLAPGFEEIEAITVIDVLRRAGAEVVVAGTQAGIIKGAHGLQVTPDRELSGVKQDPFDMIVLPGGGEGVENLRKDPRVLALVKEFISKEKPVAAICAAPSILSEAGLLRGRQATSYPSYKEAVAAGSVYSEERVVTDGKLVTSRGPGTAMEFALKLVEMLEGKEKVSELKAAMLAP